MLTVSAASSDSGNIMAHQNEPDHLIRCYTPLDLTQVLDVWESAARQAYTFFSEEQWERERNLVKHEYLPAAKTWVYECSGKVVGFAAMVGQELGGLFVQPHYQNRGIGYELVRFTQGEYCQIEVDVFAENQKAVRFYKKCGFDFIGERVHSEFQRMLIRLRWVQGG